MSIRIRILALACLLLLAAAPVHAALDEASLIQAWEEQIRSDSGTVRLEKMGEGRYAFETERFPYSGEIVVLNTDIYQDVYEYGENYAMGIVELELTGLPDDFFMKHSTSYYNWDRNNTLYYDLKNDMWLSQAAWANSWANDYSYADTGVCGVGWDSVFWLAALILLVLFLAILARKSSRQMKRAMNAQDQALKGQDQALAMTQAALDMHRETLELQRASIALLTEIRDLLKK